ncbi:hypothetical protein X740_16395 [Mesorhizobium sp. LNHC221B00]|uniref:hypothetical protein n=1 Tax=Mesorhizobium sp. LNHC221B00 TaxID=1287233 RepID=UPI0003CEEEFA|nr:hypothetical protein [Mesorhizobium sp. LNHC221B00]ESY79518.1 hypothetical protein X740_16395 [Mesorhizobium sp. LNHC221B00]
MIVRRAQAGSLGSAKLAVTALRSFLRFLQQRGLLATDLPVAMSVVVASRLAHRPKALPAEQIERLLVSSEVSALTLDDLDWDCGEIVMQGKGQRRARLRGICST